MSLKSKLEAVIYAAEEPVTLGQLATLFGAEALEWKAEEEATAARKAAAEAAAASGDVVDPSQPMIEAGLEFLDLRTEDDERMDQPGFAVLPEAGEPVESPAPVAEKAAGDAPPINTETGETESGQTETAQAQSAELEEPAPVERAPVDPEAEAKRTARQRDRDIKAILRRIIDGIIAEYASDERGIEIREIAGGYRMATKPECHDAVRMFIKSLKPPMKLSLPALETLAVIAYKQPVTAPEVNEIRGVDSSGVFGSLLARKLITTAGRKQVIGRPILYKTTKEFLMRFGLKDVNELPSMDEFEKMASELEEAEPAAVEDLGAENAAYDAEGSHGPELEENSPEDPDNDSLLPNENPLPSAESPSESNQSIHETEPAS
jgi:segregation and condensation protein B